jgi:hypothetical protein
MLVVTLWQLRRSDAAASVDRRDLASDSDRSWWQADTLPAMVGALLGGALAATSPIPHEAVHSGADDQA